MSIYLVSYKVDGEWHGVDDYGTIYSFDDACDIIAESLSLFSDITEFEVVVFEGDDSRDVTNEALSVVAKRLERYADTLDELGEFWREHSPVKPDLPSDPHKDWDEAHVFEAYEEGRK